MKADDICRKYGKQSVQLHTEVIKDDKGDVDTLLIEGSEDALKMLGEVLCAVAGERAEHSFSLSPHAAGSFHFSKQAKIGFYIKKK